MTRGVVLAMLGSGLAVVAPVVELPVGPSTFRGERETNPVVVAGADTPDRVQTAEVDTRRFTTIGIEVDRVTEEAAKVRWRTGGSWSAWTEVEIEVDEGPDRSSGEFDGSLVSAPLWVGGADGYQVDVPAEAVSDEVTTVLVRSDGRSAAAISSDVTAGASLNSPPMRGRSEWRARAPSAAPTYDDELKAVIVHHSATANGYSASQVPEILRSIQAFHMDGRGWNDIAYNFIVDRFGRIWEGRGEADRLARGAHAQGFNTDTVGVMVLGEYGAIEPTDVQLDAVADVAAWRFANERVDPVSSVAYVSAGSTSIPAGQTVTLGRVIGHRDVGSTGCPGAFLYSVLWAVRARVNDRGPAARSPAGALDAVAFAPGQIRLSGWAADPDTSQPIDVHVYLDGAGYNLGAASVERADVAAAHRRLGSRHGFSRTFGGLQPGRHRACVYAINTGVGSNRLIECQELVIPSGDPIGRVTSLVGRPDGRIEMRGYAIDPDVFDAVSIHVYVDGRGTNLGSTSVESVEAGLEVPLFGGGRGFEATLGGLAPGPHEVCVYAINVGIGANRLLTCTSVPVPTGSPFGSFDAASGLPDGRVSVAGWAIDPDTASSIPVHVYVGAIGFNLGPAGAPRADVAQAFAGYGPSHGFGSVLSGVAVGTHRVCAFGINTGRGENSLVGCRTVEVPGGSPFGSLDAVTPLGGGSVSVAGWAIDPDVSRPAEVHVYVGGDGRNLGPAAALRSDVANAFPRYGPAHGFTATLNGFGSGQRRVCVYGSNVGTGSNQLLGCRDVVLP